VRYHCEQLKLKTSKNANEDAEYLKLLYAVGHLVSMDLWSQGDPAEEEPVMLRTHRVEDSNFPVSYTQEATLLSQKLLLTH
jgi:hypothetical protein